MILTHSWLLPLVVLLGTGCELLTSEPNPLAAKNIPALPTPPNASGGSSGSPSSSGAPRPNEDMPAPTTRTARLSHEQYENAVRDLFMLPETNTTFSSAFRTDPSQAGFIFRNGVLSMEVDQLLWDAYQDAAEAVAAYVMTDTTRRARILPVTTASDDERAATFIRTFGERALRRPLKEAEVTSYVGLYNTGRSLYTGVPPLEAGTRLVVEAMLQSPYFIYRVEESSATSDGVIALSPFEVASRLSFTLWASMPDDALFAAARDGSLSTAAGVRAQAARLLASPRASAVLYAFHQQMFNEQKFSSIHPSASVFPNAAPSLAASATKEHELFLKDLFENGGSYHDVLTSNRTFVNQDLAAVYGLPGTFGAEFRSVTLDPAQRRGILTHAGFLASNANAVNPDPIHRGVFISRLLSCNPLSAPPANIPPLPTDVADKTNRQVVEAHTETPNTICISCHGLLINPYGFPFENYDATGAVRTQDNGQPVNTATQALVDGDVVPVANALDLVDKLAASQQVHDCYVQRLVEFTHGRVTTSVDHAMISRLGSKSLVDNVPLRDLVADLVSSPAFLNRSVEELP